MSKKSQVFMDFLINYGWAILVVLAAIVALFYFGVLDPCRFNKEYCDKTNESLIDYPNDICKNLTRNGSVYFGIVEEKSNIESILGGQIVYIQDDHASARMFNEFGVMCNLQAEYCEKGYAFCMNITMVIPVNYTEWNDWREK